MYNPTEDHKGYISSIRGIRVCERYLTDFDIMNEVFIENAYNVNLPIETQVIVMDIGMNIGIVSLYFATQNWCEKVYGYEPFQDTFQQALENFKMNNKLLGKIISQNFGLLDKECSTTVSGGERLSGHRSVLHEVEDNP